MPEAGDAFALTTDGTTEFTEVVAERWPSDTTRQAVGSAGRRRGRPPSPPLCRPEAGDSVLERFLVVRDVETIGYRAYWMLPDQRPGEVLMAGDVPTDEPITARLTRWHSASYGTWGGQSTWSTPLSEPCTLEPVPDDSEYSHAGHATCHNCGTVVTIRRPRPVSRRVLVRRRPLHLALLVVVCLTALAISGRIGAAVLGEPDGLAAFAAAMLLVGLVTWVSLALVGGSLLAGPPEAVTDPVSTSPTDPRGPCSHSASLMAAETDAETDAEAVAKTPHAAPRRAQAP
jgi:hypothetical protein